MSDNTILNAIDSFRTHVLSLIPDLKETYQMLRFESAMSPEVRSKVHNIKFLFNFYSQETYDIDDVRVKGLLSETSEILENIWIEASTAQHKGYSGSLSKVLGEAINRLPTICEALNSFVKSQRNATPGEQSGAAQPPVASQSGSLDGEWSKPMEKAALMKALGLDSYKKLNTFGRSHLIRKAGSQKLWQIRLNGLNKDQIERLAKA